jgi:hypothetical protein
MTCRMGISSHNGNPYLPKKTLHIRRFFRWNGWLQSCTFSSAGEMSGLLLHRWTLSLSSWLWLLFGNVSDAIDGFC